MDDNKWYLVVMTGNVDNGAEYFTNNRMSIISCECQVISGPHDWEYVERNVDWPF